MKILKKCTDASITSFLMKYAVDRALDDKRYETADFGPSLRRVLRYYTVRTKFFGVHPCLSDIGVKEIEVTEEGFLFKKSTAPREDKHVTKKRTESDEKIQKLEEEFSFMKVQMEEQQKEQRRQLQKYKNLQEQNRNQERQNQELKKHLLKLKKKLKEDNYYDSDSN